MKAIKLSPLSLTVPMLTFTPAFLLITSPLIIGEFPRITGIIGILLIVLGSYFLSIMEIKKGILAPFKALFREKGALLMLSVAFIWSITSNYDKVGIINSSPLFWIVAVNLFLSLLLLPLMLVKSKSSRNFRLDFRKLSLLGFFSGLSLVFDMTARSLTLVANVIAIKRMSVMFTSLYGFFYFKEKRMKERLVGIFIMLAGVILITLF